ncbi:hypothetical protein BKG82_26665 [Mycobacteroides chelonae]|uniref:Uncharacterized protein n=1 Tax=Mycobacteroides chelonae TaxID=1774 RepID=A0A1S1LFZ8_MYCCH|nr:hypothetical protein [Mycobacteroides chelonae]OHU47240.1 hypothetical protein BKG82_26665 [Mycobacteroides chelonae]
MTRSASGWLEFDLGPLSELPREGSERILVQCETGLAGINVVNHSTQVLERLVSQGWEIHAPLFHVEGADVIPNEWREHVVIYNLGDHNYARCNHVPVADDPNTVLEEMVQRVTERDGVKRAVYLPLIDIWTGRSGWFADPFGDRLQEAAAAILLKDSGVSLVIASSMTRCALPTWAQFDISLLARWYGVQVLRPSISVAD